jgi:predicted phosphodiesterase
MAGDPITAIVKRLVKAHPDHPARGIARMVVKETRNAITLEAARRRVRGFFGTAGVRARKEYKDKTPREPRQAGVIYRMPPSIAEPWTPYVLEATGRVGILSDVHIPYHSEMAVMAAVSHLKKARIEALLLNGDVCDFYSISRHMKDPKQRDFSDELSACREFLGWLRQQFKGIPIVFKLGNHEERFQHFIWQHAPELSREKHMSLQAWLHIRDHGIEMVEDKRPVMLGKLPVLHGHELPNGVAAPVNPARGAFMRTLHTVLVGHSHRTSTHTESNMWHEETACFSTGCLCDMTPEYARINRWNHGFAMATVEGDGEFGIENYRISSDGKVRSA